MLTLLSDALETSSWLSVIIALLLVSVNIFVSFQFALGLKKTFLTASFRCFAQLILVSYILTPAFSINTWWFTIIFLFIILALSSAEAVSRPPAGYEGMLINIFAILLCTCSLILTFAGFLIFQGKALDAKLYIPIICLLLNSCINGISSGLSALMVEFESGTDGVDFYLSVGASRFEASRGILQRSLLAAFDPLVNQLRTAGVVCIPEFMLGQLAAGASPMIAAQMQICILLLSSVCTVLASSAAVFSTLYVLIDGSHQLHYSKLHSRNGRSMGFTFWAQIQLLKGTTALKSKLRKVSTRISVAVRNRSRRSKKLVLHQQNIQSPLQWIPLNEQSDECEEADRHMDTSYSEINDESQ